MGSKAKHFCSVVNVTLPRQLNKIFSMSSSFINNVFSLSNLSDAYDNYYSTDKLMVEQRRSLLAK